MAAMSTRASRTCRLSASLSRSQVPSACQQAGGEVLLDAEHDDPVHQHGPVQHLAQPREPEGARVAQLAEDGQVEVAQVTDSPRSRGERGGGTTRHAVLSDDQ